MALTAEVDMERRLVMARAHGVLTYEDIEQYQKTLWTRPEVKGFNEIVDVSDVEKIDYQSSHHVRELAVLASEMDGVEKSRLAIVASEAGAYGIARMYQTYRGLQSKSTKEVAVFHTMDEAMKWLGVERTAGAGRAE
ncbi:MAG: hypothetical protein AB1752_08865 [Candidatus Zixiibacteriota bacterium]